MSQLEKLQQLKIKNKFPIEDWLPRGLNPSPAETISEMNKDVNGFIDLLIAKIDISNKEELDLTIQSYFDNWYRGDLDTVEGEWVIDKKFEILESLGIETDHFFL